MQWILCGTLVILLLIVYQLDKKDVTTPSVISIAVYLISSMFFAINANKWAIHLNISTILLIISALVIFFTGTKIHLTKKTVASKTDGKIEKNDNYYYKVPKRIIVLLFLFNCIAAFFIYKRAMQIAASYSTSSYMLANIRSALADSVSWGIGISVFRESMYAIGYTCLCVFMINCVPQFKIRVKKNIYILLPVLPMFVAMFFSTGRTGFIRAFVVVFSAGLLKYTYFYKIHIGKFVKIGGAVFVILLIVFVQLGKATGKSQIFAPFDMLSVYIGSSIGALNEYMKKPESFSTVFAGETLYGIRALLKIINSKIVSTEVALPFTYVKGGYNTNVYTSLRRYINDFGILGMFIIQFFKGVLYGSWSYNLKKYKNVGLFFILYSYFIYDIFMQSIEENFLREFLTIAQIFILVVFVFVYNICIKPYKSTEKLV